MRLLKTLLCTAAVTLLAACGQPVPADKAAYVGEWKGPSVSLVIEQSGRVDYKNTASGMSKSIDAPIKAFNGNDFEVGVGPMSTVFKVSAPPHEVDGKWKMTVDGVELTRE